jgi:hypothetical protein
MSSEYKDFIGKATETDDKLRPTGKELITHPFLARRSTAAEVGAIAARASAAKAAKADEPEQEEEEFEQEDEVPVWNSSPSPPAPLLSSSPPVTGAPPRPVKPTTQPAPVPVKRSLPNPAGFKKGTPDTPKKVPALPGKTGKKLPPMPVKGPPKLQPPPPPIQETPFEVLDPPPANPVEEDEDAWSD